uniref:Uncharacterized protein n=1 Tax=Sphaerodactylus townsendi TaxID=933632 RepID=A0ACB8ETQ4_9SAUR
MAFFKWAKSDGGQAGLRVTWEASICTGFPTCIEKKLPLSIRNTASYKTLETKSSGKWLNDASRNPTTSLCSGPAPPLLGLGRAAVTEATRPQHSIDRCPQTLLTTDHGKSPERGTTLTPCQLLELRRRQTEEVGTEKTERRSFPSQAWQSRRPQGK